MCGEIVLTHCSNYKEVQNVNRDERILVTDACDQIGSELVMELRQKYGGLTEWDSPVILFIFESPYSVFAPYRFSP